MTTFDERDKSFENKYAHDEELTFKANARRNKLVGLWAAEKLGKEGTLAEQYALDIVESDFVNTGSSDVVEKLLKDFTDAGVAITSHEILVEMDRLLGVARQQIMGDKK